MGRVRTRSGPSSEERSSASHCEVPAARASGARSWDGAALAERAPKAYTGAECTLIAPGEKRFTRDVMDAPQAGTEPFSVLLVVDDDALVRTFLRDELEARGQVVLTARDAQEARTLLEQVEDRVVVVLDLMLPGMNGIELLAELHPRSPSHLRFVLVSASQVVGKVAQDHPLVVGRLEKPIDLTRLVQHVSAAQSELALTPG